MQNNSSWYIVLTQPQCERSTVAGLIARRYRAYGPTVRMQRRTGRRDQNGRSILRDSEGPMFPGYIFVELPSQDFRGVMGVPGVRDFLCIHTPENPEGKPCTVPTREMDLMRQTEARELEAHSKTQALLAMKGKSQKRWRQLPDFVHELSMLSGTERNEKLYDLVGLGKQQDATAA